MFIFLRKIRKALLTNNKLTTYLVYAVGEIVLVVIGILIAVSINNWNEQRQLLIKEQQYLHNLRKDLISDSLAISEGLQDKIQKVENLEWLLRTGRRMDIPMDTLVDRLGFGYFGYSLNDETYKKMINAGVTNFNSNPDIFEKVNQYYTHTANYFDSFKVWDRDANLEIAGYYTNSSGIEMGSGNTGLSIMANNYPFVQSEEERKIIFYEFLRKPKTRNYLRRSIFRKNRTYENMEQTLSEARGLIKAIDEVQDPKPQ